MDISRFHFLPMWPPPKSRDKLAKLYSYVNVVLCAQEIGMLNKQKITGWGQ